MRLKFDENTEFFIAVGRLNEPHSFIMVGAVPKNEKPQLLARVGKVTIPNSVTSPSYLEIISEGIKLIKEGVPARLKDEHVIRKSLSTDVSYQAYALTYDQLIGFFSLLKRIESDLDARPAVKIQIEGVSFRRMSSEPTEMYYKKLLRSQYIRFLNNLYYYDYENHQCHVFRFPAETLEAFDAQFTEHSIDLLSAAQIGWIETNMRHRRHVIESITIQCFLPIDLGSYVFSLQKLRDWTSHVSDIGSDKSSILNNAYFLNINNTCRSTAVDIVEYIFGLTGEISRNFLTTLPYKTILIKGAPEKESFYILPAPANAFPDHPHRDSLNVLFKRLKEIPKYNPKSEKTRQKFNELKKEYMSLAGNNTLTATDLCTKIGSMLANDAIIRNRSEWHCGLFSWSTTRNTLLSLQKTIKANVATESGNVGNRY